MKALRIINTAKYKHLVDFKLNMKIVENVRIMLFYCKNSLHLYSVKEIQIQLTDPFKDPILENINPKIQETVDPSSHESQKHPMSVTHIGKHCK